MAQFNMGNMYTLGSKDLSLAHNTIEAVKWYRRAAELGLAAAQFKLGSIYAGGIGVPQDDTESVKWYRKAAEQGHDGAQDMLEVINARNANRTFQAGMEAYEQGDFATALREWRPYGRTG